MSIITEYKNHIDIEIAQVTRVANKNLNGDTITETINGKEVSYTVLSSTLTDHLNLNQKEYISTNTYNEYWRTEGETKTLFAIKSKKENSQYNYLCFYTVWGANLWHTVGVALSKDPYVANDYSNCKPLRCTSMGFPSRYASFWYTSFLDIGEYIGLVAEAETRTGSGAVTVTHNFVGIKKTSVEELLGIVERNKTSDEYGGISDSDGYDPNFDNSSDIISIPSTPVIGVSNVGFVNVYRPTQGALQNLGSDLFPDFEELPEVQPDDDVLVMLSQGFEHLGKNISTLLKSYINSNLINYIIDCHCLPVTPTTGESENIKIGFKSFDQKAQRVTSDYVDFDCGSLNIKEYYGNFIDYIGTRASLYLPFVGFVPIKNEYWQSGTLSVKYRFNVIDGSFMCYVLATSSKSNLKDSVIGTYSGNACVHIPITGVNYSNMVSGVVTGGASLIGGVATGNVGLAVSGALNTIASKPQMQSSNSYNSTSSFLGIRYPYLLIEREVSNFSELYPSENGLPLNVTKTISELSGYVQMDDNIHININCMDEEKEMLKGLLTSGIII